MAERKKLIFFISLILWYISHYPYNGLRPFLYIGLTGKYIEHSTVNKGNKKWHASIWYFKRKNRKKYANKQKIRKRLKKKNQRVFCKLSETKLKT